MNENLVIMRIEIRKDQYELLTAISDKTLESLNEVVVSLLDKALYKNKSIQKLLETEE